jgi:cell division protein FtsB
MGWTRQWWERLGGGRLRPIAAQGERLVHWVREDDNTWSERAPRPFLLFLILFGAAMVAVSLFGDQGLFAYRSLAGQTRQLREEVSALDAREQELARQVRALRSDPAAIERLARQKLGLVKPGETVIQLPAPVKPE